MLRLINIGKRFGSQTAVDSVSLDIQKGEFFSLLGPSGCGKTTLLRIIAGLESASTGKIQLESERIDTLPPQSRPCNMVFQRYALFPHLSVARNVAFGLEAKGVGASETKARVRESLALVGMADLADRAPDTLSGGQQQRVALARALVNRPRVLLLDEPLSALDQKLREHMQAELRSLQKKLGLTFIFVTHDQEEAMALSDRIGVMHAGRLVEVGTPAELYTNPKSGFVAGFVGRRSVLPGKLARSASGDNGGFLQLDLGGGLAVFGVASGELIEGGAVHALVRPESIHISSGVRAAAADNSLVGKVVHRVFRGAITEVHAEVGEGIVVQACVSARDFGADAALGDSLALSFARAETLLFPAERAP